MWRPCLALMFVALLVAGATAQGDAARTNQERAELTAVLGAAGTTFEKAKACQRLAVIGDASSVPAIAPLLLDPQLSGYARTALEQIPGEAATEALVAAVEILHGSAAVEGVGAGQGAVDAQQRERLLIGLIHSLGRRSNESPHPLLAEIAAATDASAAVRDTAAQALGTREAAAAPEAVPPAELATLLRSADGRMFRHGLQQARLQDDSATAVLAEQLPQLQPPRQIAVLIALADLGDSSIINAIEPLTKSEDDEVAATAWESIVTLGGLREAADRAAEVFQTAIDRPAIAPRLLNALARADVASIDSQVQSTVRELAEDKQTLESPVAIGLFDYAVARELSDVTEPLLQIAQSQSEPAVAAAAMRAAGSLATIDGLARLLAASEQLSQQAPEGPLALAAAESLQRATVRMPPDEVADVIAGLLAEAEGARKALLLEQLAYVGGERALEVVADIARSTDLADVDLATRVLGQWLSTDAADVLSELAENLNHPAYRLRTLRGYLRLGRQFDMPPEQRTELATRAYQLAERDEERTLALEILLRFPTPEGVRWLADMSGGNRDLNGPQRQEVNRVLLQVAGYVAREQPERFAAVLQAVDLQQLPEVLQSELLQLTEPAETR